jgi:hypothetical protein
VLAGVGIGHGTGKRLVPRELLEEHAKHKDFIDDTFRHLGGGSSNNSVSSRRSRKGKGGEGDVPDDATQATGTSVGSKKWSLSHNRNITTPLQAQTAPSHDISAAEAKLREDYETGLAVAPGASEQKYQSDDVSPLASPGGSVFGDGDIGSPANMMEEGTDTGGLSGGGSSGDGEEKEGDGDAEADETGISGDDHETRRASQASAAAALAATAMSSERSIPTREPMTTDGVAHRANLATCPYMPALIKFSGYADDFERCLVRVKEGHLNIKVNDTRSGEEKAQRKAKAALEEDLERNPRRHSISEYINRVHKSPHHNQAHDDDEHLPIQGFLHPKTWYKKDHPLPKDAVVRFASIDLMSEAPETEEGDVHVDSDSDEEESLRQQGGADDGRAKPHYRGSVRKSRIHKQKSRRHHRGVHISLDKVEKDQLYINHWLHGMVVIRLAMHEMLSLTEALPPDVYTRAIDTMRPDYADLTQDVIDNGTEYRAPATLDDGGNDGAGAGGSRGDKKRGDSMLLRGPKDAKRRSVEFLLQGAAATLAGAGITADDDIMEQLQGLASKGKEGEHGEGTADDRDKIKIKVKVKAGAMQSSSGGGKDEREAEASYHDARYNDPESKVSNSSMADLVRDQYTSRGKDYRAMRVHPRRAAHLLRWVNSLGLNPVPVTEESLHSSFCSGLLLADLVRYLIPAPILGATSQMQSVFAAQLHIPVLSKKQAVFNVETVLSAILRSRAFVFSERIPPAVEIVEGNSNRIYLLLDELFRAFVVRDFIDYRIDVPTMVARGLSTASLRRSQKKKHHHHHSLFHNTGFNDAVESDSDKEEPDGQGDRYTSSGGWDNSRSGASTFHHRPTASTTKEPSASSSASASQAKGKDKGKGKGGPVVRETRATRLLKAAKEEAERESQHYALHTKAGGATTGATFQEALAADGAGLVVTDGDKTAPVRRASVGFGSGAGKGHRLSISASSPASASASGSASASPLVPVSALRNSSGKSKTTVPFSDGPAEPSPTRPKVKFADAESPVPVPVPVTAPGPAPAPAPGSATVTAATTATPSASSSIVHHGNAPLPTKKLGSMLQWFDTVLRLYQLSFPKATLALMEAALTGSLDHPSSSESTTSDTSSRALASALASEVGAPP